MRISLVDIDGFGVLCAFRAELNPRINLFTGENEAGKSTLQQAILALIYGFYSPGRALPAERTVHERYRPWTAGAYRGLLEYSLDSGQRFRIQRSFETDDINTSVIDLATGRDLVPELGPGRHGSVPVGTAHLGMGREVFVNTCFVSQASVASIEKPDAVSEAIVSMADTATTDSSAEQAVRRLDVAISQIGGSRASSKPLPAARARLQKARTELQALEADYLALQQSAAEKDECEELLGRLKAEQRLISYRVASARLKELDDGIGALEGIDRMLAGVEAQMAGLADVAGFPVETRDTVLAQKGRLDSLLQQRAGLQARSKDLPAQIETLSQEIQECQQAIEALGYSRGFPLEREEDFNRLRFSLEASRERVAGLRRDEGKPEDFHLGRQDRKAVRTPALVSGLAVAIVLGVLVAITGSPAAGLIAGVLIAAGTLVVLYLYRDPPPGMAKPEGLRSALLAEEERAAEMEGQLELLFLEVGVRTETVDSGVVAFQKRIVAARDLAQREAELVTMGEKLKRLLAERRQVEDSENQALEAERALLGTLRRSGIDEPDIEKGISLFQERCDRRTTLDQLQDRGNSLRDRRMALLGNRTEALSTGQRDNLRTEVSEMLASMPDLARVATESCIESLEAEASALGQGAAEAQERKARLEATMQAVLSKHRPRAEIEEDIACFEEEVSRLARFSAALTLARDMLRQSSEEVHRDFAPRLAQSLGRSLQHVTQGRYHSAFVDPKDFAIRLECSGAGQPVHVGSLSTGTREQAYLLLRVELARILSSSRESLPLIMDDPFVNYDDKRLRRVMELLAEVSAEHQVLLFTKDSSASEWLRSCCRDTAAFTVHSLPGPAPG